MRITNLRRALVLVAASVLFLTGWLVVLTPTGKAGTLNQTIPTAAPPTATSTQSPPSSTPTRRVVPTSVAPQPTLETATQTDQAEASATVEGVTSTSTSTSTSASASATAVPGGGTIPQATEGEATRVVITGVAPAMRETTTPGGTGTGSGLGYYLCGGGVALLVVVGVAWLLRRRKKTEDRKGPDEGG